MTRLQRWQPRRLLLALLFVGSAAQAADTITVGSKIDTEGALLGNIILKVLQAHGVNTVNKLQIGNTQVVRKGLIAGQIDIYPEYTGNGAFFFNVEKDPAWKNAQAGYDRVKSLDWRVNRIVWLDPAPANNTWAIAVRQDLAQSRHLKSLADLGRYLKSGGVFKLAASAEFIERPDALPAFQQAYGFTLKPDQLLSLAGGDTAVTIKAAAEKTSGVNAAMAYGTDGPLAALGLVVLEDVKGVQPIYAPTPIIREAALARQPKIRDWLRPVFQSLTGPTLQSLNAKIALDGQDAGRVAADYLKARGFVK
ncbi:glycine betaine ABC transporter substrate-binding protein OsmF [Paludibacterium purpuratum]|uniref:Osmoprotectant transport system substrate-binding protein n=1 Tax=Paludibacterium purpuratum TaxID=1144873 RepID=A0A4R7B972_9NEIS|nr:ABC transporter substrate-binding protein [Paludibacterium purpuratum]TDR80236.1 osmoprotectant transport system substrate-binding protein [Paludibacterium purpuratum]